MRKRQRGSRREFEKTIQGFIRYANFIPVHYYFPEPPADFHQLTKRKQAEWYRSFEAQVGKVIAEGAGRFEWDLLTGFDTESSPKTFFWECVLMNRTRELLRAIARANAVAEASRKKSVLIEWEHPARFFVKDGVFGGADLCAHMLGADVNRVRMCAVCERLYWQHRRGVAYCRSGTCGNKFNVDKFRGKPYTEKYKINRILKPNRKAHV